MVDSTVQHVYVRYSDEQRRSLYGQILRLRYGPFDKHHKRATWEAIADALDINRSTIQEWRSLEDYQRAEIAYRKLLREEARTDASGMAQTALDHLYYLMLNSRSDFVQLEAAKEITKITQLDKELEEAQLESNQGLVEFQKLMLARKEKVKKLKGMGIDPNSIIDVEVKPGGFLPDAIVTQNEEIKKELVLVEILLDEDDDLGF